MEIRELTPEEAPAAYQLAWAVFQEYEAPEYTQQGIESFHRLLQDPGFTDMLTAVYGALENGRVVGTLATRSEGNHIALFFVDGAHHRQGIGKKLFELALRRNSFGRMTVNSSPYAVEVYRRLGFAPTGVEQVADGIRFTPMERFTNRASI